MSDEDSQLGLLLRELHSLSTSRRIPYGGHVCFLSDPLSLSKPTKFPEERALFGASRDRSPTPNGCLDVEIDESPHTSQRPPSLNLSTRFTTTAAARAAANTVGPHLSSNPPCPLILILFARQ